MEELELKFVLNEQTEKQLRENPELFRLGGGRASTESLHSIYYDTKDRALKAAGIALRLRRKGRAWLQTVKSGRVIRSGLSSATESESRAPGGRLRRRAWACRSPPALPSCMAAASASTALRAPERA